METLSQISLGTAALIIFAVCAAYMLIRGLLKTFIHVSILAISLWIGFQTWQQAPSYAVRWTDHTHPLITHGLPILAFLLSFIFLRKILKFFFSPIVTKSQEYDDDPPAKSSLIWRLIVTLIPATALCLIGAALIHHATSVAEIREHAKGSEDSRESNNIAALLKDALDKMIPSDLMDKLDPLATQPRIQLAKLIAENSGERPPSEIDPTTGEPIPRAIIVDDPDLISLAKDGRFSTLLRHPLLSKALEDPKIIEKLRGN